MGQIKFGEYIGISQSAISKIELGKLSVSGDRLCRMIALHPVYTVRMMKKKGKELING